MQDPQTADDLMESYAAMDDTEKSRFRAMLTGYDMHANPEAKKRGPRKAKDKTAEATVSRHNSEWRAE